MQHHETTLQSGVDLTRLSLADIRQIADLNLLIFQEERIINRYDYEHLFILLLRVDGMRAGFKIGYGLGDGVFYSAKGGVMPAWRRRGFARLMLREMMMMAHESGYRRFEFDTLANTHREMLIFSLQEGFWVKEAEKIPKAVDFRLRLSVSIPDYLLRTGGLPQDDF